MSDQYKILINDRQYSDWQLYNALSLNEIDKLDINPVSEKLFSCDIFDIYNDKINIKR